MSLNIRGSLGILLLVHCGFSFAAYVAECNVFAGARIKIEAPNANYRQLLVARHNVYPGNGIVLSFAGYESNSEIHDADTFWKLTIALADKERFAAVSEIDLVNSEAYFSTAGNSWIDSGLGLYSKNITGKVLVRSDNDSEVNGTLDVTIAATRADDIRETVSYKIKGKFVAARKRLIGEAPLAEVIPTKGSMTNHLVTKCEVQLKK